jgi:signal transduction histidine kinase
LAFVNTKAQAVREFLRQGRNEEAGEHMEQLAAAAREVYKDVREGILGLRTVVDAEHDLAETLRRYSESWQDQCGITVLAELAAVPRFAADVELQLLRIVQEAMANVRKHAQAETVRLSLLAIPDGLCLKVEDDGVGMKKMKKGTKGPGRAPRFGLATMRERAEAIGAELEMHSRLGEGTRWTLTYRGPKQGEMLDTRWVGEQETMQENTQEKIL